MGFDRFVPAFSSAPSRSPKGSPRTSPHFSNETRSLKHLELRQFPSPRIAHPFLQFQTRLSRNWFTAFSSTWQYRFRQEAFSLPVSLDPQIQDPWQRLVGLISIGPGQSSPLGGRSLIRNTTSRCAQAYRHTSLISPRHGELPVRV